MKIFNINAFKDCLRFKHYVSVISDMTGPIGIAGARRFSRRGQYTSSGQLLEAVSFHFDPSDDEQTLAAKIADKFFKPIDKVDHHFAFYEINLEKSLIRFGGFSSTKI